MCTTAPCGINGGIGRSILVARLAQVERYEIGLVITALPVMEWVVAQLSGSGEH